MRIPFIVPALGLMLGAQAALAQTSGRPVPGVFTEAPSLLSGRSLQQTQQYYSGYKVLQLDVVALRTQLAGAPLEFTGGTPKLLTLPLPQGGTATFSVYESPVLAPNIAAQNPGIKTYSLQATSGSATGRLSFIDGVLNVVLFQADGDREVYFQKLAGVANGYLSYSTRQVKALPKSGPNAYKNACGTAGNGPAKSIKSLLASVPRHNGLGQRTGAVLRTYRLAVAATREFTGHVGFAAAGDSTQQAGLTAVVNMVNVAKGVYRRELSVDLVLVSGTNTINTRANNPGQFLVNSTGSNEDHQPMLAQSQTFLTNTLGANSFDVGHVLGFQKGITSGGGIASKGSVCQASLKGQGVSAVSLPAGSFPQVYQDQVFAHEMGHQFGMDHSFNSSIPVCTTREAAYSVEPGAGTTIMSYGYTCDNTKPANGPVGNDNYAPPGAATGGLPFLNFHAANIVQALDYMSNTAICNTSTNTNNALPTISTVSTGFTIPKSTPFTLTGAASGGAGTLSYSWEGMDVGATPQTGTVPSTELDDASKAPFFRSYAPMSTATRTFPLLSAILDGTNQAKGDKLPSVGRTINLRLTTRDGMGGVDEMNSALTVDGNSGPFLITSNLAGTYASGSTQTVTWSVNNTNQAPVSCANVAILLSADGGQTFGTTLLTSTANDGTESVQLPYLGAATSQARLKVQSVGNIFFDISNSDFSISAGQAPVLTLTTSVSGSSFCAGSAVSVGFVATQAPNAGNVYTAQLSDASGSFAAPVSLGTLSSVATSGSVSGTIPTGIIQGSGYRVRVVGSDPATIGTDNGTNLTVNNTPAPTGTASQSFSNGATVANLAATGTAVQWYAASTGGTALAGTTALVNGTTYYATQTLNGCESLSRLAVAATVSAPTAPDLTVSTGSSASPISVAAGTYNNITVTGTGYAQLSGAVVVNGAFQVQDGGSLNTSCQSLTGAGSFELAAGGTLAICDAAGITSSGATGAVQTTGTRSFSPDANYIYIGTIAQATGNGLPSQVRNLAVNKTSSNLTLSQAVAVRQVLAMTSTGNLLTNSKTLTLLSDATGTALVANTSTGLVNGNVTVQRYIDGSVNPGLGYRHLAVPVASATVAAFGSGGTTPVVNSDYNSATSPLTVTPFPTVFSYDQSRLASSPATTLAAFDKGWVSPASLTETVNLATKGFTVQLPGASTLSFIGQVGNGSGTIPLSRASGATAADAGWNLIGNPYPSPLDFSSITASQRTNLDAAYYVFESASQYGGTYRSYVNGVGTNTLVGTAQAFFVRVSSGQTFGALSLTNGNRITSYGQQAPVRRTASQRPLVQLALAGQGLADTFYAYAEAGATAAFDSEFDATKLVNTHGLNVNTTSGTVESLAIDGRAAFTATTSFPLTVSVPAAGTYTFTAAQLDNLPAGLTAYVYDAATGSSTALSTGTVYSFQVAAAQAAAPIAGRFTLQFSPNAPLAAAPAALAAQVSVFPNPAHEQVTVGMPGIAGATAVQAELLNTLGQVVRRQSAALPAAGTAFGLTTTGLAPGVYTLRLTAGATFVTKRLTIQ